MLFNIFIIYRENTSPKKNIYEEQLKAEKPQNSMVPDKAMDGLAKGKYVQLKISIIIN